MPSRRPPRPEGPPQHHAPRRDARLRPKRKARASARGPNEQDGDRLQKLLAHAGVGSRRACEEMILQGRVTVDGEIVRELGTKVDPKKAVIAIDGQRVAEEPPVYFAVNKPKGYVSTNNDPSGRPRVVDLLPEVPQRVYSVGRLDEMSTGLMLLTNDGELANKLTHPKFGVEKVYRVVVAGTPAREVLDKLIEGVWLAEGKVRAKRVKQLARKGDATVLEMVLAEGKNREVRRMLAKMGHKVMTLVRTSVGPITMKGLKPGHWRRLSSYEVDLLKKVAAGIPVPAPRGTRERDRMPSRSARGPERHARDQRRPGPANLPDALSAGPGGANRRPPRPGATRRPPTSAPQDRRPAGPPEGRHPLVPQGLPPSQRPPAQAGRGGRPASGPPQRRPPAPPQVRRPAPPPTDGGEPRRRIIGMPEEARPPVGGARGPRRPAPRRRPGVVPFTPDAARPPLRGKRPRPPLRDEGGDDE